MSETSGAIKSFCFPSPDGAASCTKNKTFQTVELINLYDGVILVKIVPPKMHGRFRIGLPKMHGQLHVGFPKVNGRFRIH